MDHLNWFLVRIPDAVGVPYPSATMGSGMVLAYLLVGFFVAWRLVRNAESGWLRWDDKIVFYGVISILWPLMVELVIQDSLDDEEESDDSSDTEDGEESGGGSGFSCRGCGQFFDSKQGRGMHESRWCNEVDN